MTPDGTVMSGQPRRAGGVRFRKRGRSQGCRIRYRAIGGGAGGLSASFSVDVHSNGRCTTADGVAIASIARSAARNTASCPAASPGRPTVMPNGCSIAAILGAPALAVSSGIMDSEIVLNPAASISRCTSPTDQQHTGQTGTSATTSTTSSRKRRTIPGRASRRSGAGRSV